MNETILLAYAGTSAVALPLFWIDLIGMLRKATPEFSRSARCYLLAGVMAVGLALTWPLILLSRAAVSFALLRKPK